jgi:hypothetical protein
LPRARRSLFRPAFPLVFSPVLTLLSGCSTEADTSAPPFVDLQPLPSPAGESSGEPHLTLSEQGVILSWLQASDSSTHELRISHLSGDTWSPPATVAASDAFFVNWADFPTVAEVAPGRLAAHWLQRGGAGGYDYGVRVAESTDGGRSWSDPWTPHEDQTPTEHGFVSLFGQQENGWGLVWLDGREFHAPEGVEPAREMTLRYRGVSTDGTRAPEVEVDGRICDCCQTDAAVTSRGPLVVYRDRSADEIRDIYVTRLVDGAWTAGTPVHADGWHIDACPVNGPAAAAREDQVAVAWFTGAGDQPRVKVAFSGDAGATFGSPVQVDGGNPSGRVDVLLLDDESALVTWLERVGDGRAEVRARRIWSDGAAGPAITVTSSSDARASGFPRAVLAPDGTLVFAWTDVQGGASQIKVARARSAGR